MEIKEVILTQKFENDIKHIRDALMKEKIQKHIAKIIERPEIGKPLKYFLKGERTIYIWPYRLIYTLSGDKLILLRFEHRKEAYNQ